MSTLRSATLAVLIGSAVVPWASGQTFTLIEPPPGPLGVFTRASGVSYDGGTVSGFSLRSGYTWTADGGRYDLRNDPGVPLAFSAAYGISGDGLAIVGAARATDAGDLRAYRWRGDGTFQSLGVVGPYRASYALDANVDGSVIVGRVQDTQGFGAEAFRWTESGGMQRLGHSRPNARYSEAAAVSGDGSTVVGWTDYFSGSEAFIWTTNGGMQVLQNLPGTTTLSQARAVNSLGTVVVGESGISEAALWNHGIVESLGQFQGRTPIAQAVSDDGGVVAGNANGVGPLRNMQAIVWTRANGWSFLADYLAMHQVMVPEGWTLVDCTATSADGMTFVGHASTREGLSFAFHAQIPNPGTFAVLGGIMVWAVKRKR